VSALDDIRGWWSRRQGAGTPEGLVPAEKLAAQARRDAEAPQAADGRDRELIARRDRLAERFTLMQADLGGVFYEMAIREHVRMDVLTRKAAELQRVDADLADVERMLRGYDGPPAGLCPACSAPHGKAASFCSRCGTTLEQPASPVLGKAPDADLASTNGNGEVV